MSEYILSAKTDKEKEKRLLEVINGSKRWQDYKLSKEEKERVEGVLNKAKNVAKEINVKGVPSIYNEKLEQIR
jgi:thiol:disulfide interchange protein DsbC